MTSKETIKNKKKEQDRRTKNKERGRKNRRKKTNTRRKDNNTPGDFINQGLLLKLKVFFVEILQKEGKFKTKLLAAREFISPPQGALIVCRKRGASGQEKHFAIDTEITWSETIALLNWLARPSELQKRKRDR